MKMVSKKIFDNALNAAAKLDGNPCIEGGNAAAVYIGRCIANDTWVAKADWSNKYTIYAYEKNPNKALEALIQKLKLKLIVE